MPKRGANISLSSYDDIFETDESRADAQLERVQKIPISELVPFKDHPFKVVDDEAMLRTMESIAQYGVLTPLIARPLEDGTYEIISGHRRVHAAQAAGLTEVPVIVRDMDDDAATVLMVDSNLQRENILPSERAFAYKMKLEAMKRQGERTDLQEQATSTQVGRKLETAEMVGKEVGDSRNQVRRYIRLTYLIPEFLDLVDEKKISFNPAVELSYLKPTEQEMFLSVMEWSQNAPSLSQAQRLKKLSQEGKLTPDAMREIMNEVKKGDLERVTFRNETLRKYFPRSYTAQQMQDPETSFSISCMMTSSKRKKGGWGMKVSVDISAEYKEPYAVIYTDKVTDEIQRMIDIFSTSETPITALQNEEDLIVLQPKEIFMVRVEDGDTIIYGEKNKYRSRKRLYEIGQQLGKQFMQISKTTLINLSYMDSIEPGFSGTLLLKMKNGCKDYVSRKYLPEFKKYLGL